MALSVAMLVSAMPAKAAEASPPWHGVWRGTIGKSEVQACLQYKDYGDAGAYYYLRHLAIIGLGELAAKGGASSPALWTEAPDSDKAASGPLWYLTTITRDHLQGTWTGGGKTLPLDLTRVVMAKPGADDDEDAPCGNMAFNLPRFSKPVITTRPAMLKGIAYTKVSVDVGKQFSDSAIASFQLHGTTPAITRVNVALYKDIPTSPDNAAYFQCAMAALAQNGMDGDSSSTTVPEVITRNWMVSRNDYADDCGGAHPNSGSNYQTWDLRKGIAINLYDWFTPLALKQTVNDPGTKDQYITVVFTPVFRKLIDDAYGRDDADCKEAEKEADFWTPHLTATGVDFVPDLPHVVTACTDDAIIPFAKLARYFTPMGRAQAAAFIGELRERH